MNYMSSVLDPKDPASGLSLIKTIFNGIYGPTGTVANASLQAVNLNNFGSTNNLPQSIIPNPTNIQNVGRINNQYTNTLELGYKALLARRLSVQLDGYWTRITNYVTALTPASEAVMFKNSFLGPFNNTGQLYKNLYNSNGTPNALNQFLANAGLDGNKALQNPSITPSLSGTVWDEIVVLCSQLPIGAITPNSPYVGSDYILTYENAGLVDVFGLDFGANYNAYETERHSINLGASVSWVDKDHFTLSTGEPIYLNAPKVKASASFDHTLKKSGFGYKLSFRYAMGYYASSSVYFGNVNPAYILDAGITYRLKWYKKLLLGINVNDLNNYQYSAFPGAAIMGTQCYFRAQLTF